MSACAVESVWVGGRVAPSEPATWLERTWSIEECPPRGGLPELDRFRLEARIGEGACGEVFRALDLVTQAHVALKVRRFYRGPRDTALPRLRRELRATRQLCHPGVLRSHELFQHPEHLVLSMELVRGQTLGRRIAAGAPLPPGELERLARALASALAAIHGAGIVHRDLKPSNVMLRAGTGQPVLIDFGAARLDDDDGDGGAPEGEPTELTQTGGVLGTPLYMAPEQLVGASVTKAADVYAFGLVLWEAATGVRPHSPGTIDGLRAQRRTRPPALFALRPDLPPLLCQIIDACLEPDAAQRIPDGARLAWALGRVHQSGLGERAAAAFATAMAGLALLAVLAT